MGRPLADDAEPIAVMRANDLEPLAPYPGSKPQWRSTCTRCGNEVFPRLANVRNGHRNCRTCRRDPRMLTDDEALTILVAAGLEPLAPYPGVKHPWPARCLGCGRETSPTLNSLKAGHGGCRWCGWERGSSKRRLDSEAAAQSMRHAGLEPLEPYVNTMSAWKCRCLECGAIVTPTHNMVSKGTGGCRPCGIKKSARTRTKDATEAEALMRAAGLEPVEPYPGRRHPWACRCIVCGGIVTPRLAGILAGQGGCRSCGYQKAANARKHDPDLAAELMREAGIEPLGPYPGSGVPWRGHCTTCGTEVAPRLGRILAGQGGCKPCAARRAADRSRHPDAFANETMRACGVEPLSPYPGSVDTPWPGQCLGCSAPVSPRLANLLRGQGACRACSWSARIPGRSLAVYLVVHQRLAAIKVGVGVSNRGAVTRVNQHVSNGWTVDTVIAGLPSVGAAWTAERAVLAEWDRQCVRGWLEPSQVPQRGWTETAPYSPTLLRQARAILYASMSGATAEGDIARTA